MDKESIINYLKENGQNIILVVVLIIGSMVFFSLVGIDLNPVVNNNLEKVVTIEKFTNNSFCKTNQNLKILEENCNKLTEENCGNVECCDMISVKDTSKCKAVNKHGVIYKEDFKTTKENMTSLDNNYYESYQNNQNNQNNKYSYKQKNDFDIYKRNQGLSSSNYYGNNNNQDGYLKNQMKKQKAIGIQRQRNTRHIVKPVTVRDR